MKRALITGFGPFGDVVDNPSARLAAAFQESGVDSFDLTARVMPVSFKRSCDALQAFLTEGRFDVALLLGVAANSPEIRLERYARNFSDARLPDCDLEQPQQTPIDPDGPHLYETAFRLEPLLEAVRSVNVPVRVSESAGEYVCNHAYYCAMRIIERQGLPTRCLFVHVPADARTLMGQEAEGMPLDRQARAIRAIFGGLAEQV